MHRKSTAHRAVARHGECCSLDAASAARLFAYRAVALHGGSMVAALRTELDQHAVGRRMVSRLPLGRVRSWTGRSAVAGATDSHLPRMATAGTRVTRVSAMRDLAARADRRAHTGAMVAAGRATPQRRRASAPLITSG